MSALGDIVLYCEDEPGGPMPRLLFAALQNLGREFPVALQITVEPVGSKADVDNRVRFSREDGRRCFGIRDRDFLPEELLTNRRENAVGTGEAARGWPLSRHCIESYLIDLDFLAAALTNRSGAHWHAALDGLAERRKWTDLVRATLDDARYRLTRTDRVTVQEIVPTREAALHEIERCNDAMRGLATGVLTSESATGKFQRLEEDFTDHGPLTSRVDGKQLLRSLAAELAKEGEEPPGGLRKFLLQAAEKRCPEPLLEDLRAFLNRIG